MGDAAAPPELGHGHIPLHRPRRRLLLRLVLGAVGRRRWLRCPGMGERPGTVRVLVVRRQLLVVGRERPPEVAVQVLQVVVERRRLLLVLEEGGAEALGRLRVRVWVRRRGVRRGGGVRKGGRVLLRAPRTDVQRRSWEAGRGRRASRQSCHACSHRSRR